MELEREESSERETGEKRVSSKALGRGSDYSGM